jgi:ribosomal protein S27E
VTDVVEPGSTTPSSGPRHAQSSSGSQTISVTCPDCRGAQQVDPAATSAECSHCGKTISSVDCDACGNHFATVKRRKFQCPRCLNSMRTIGANAAPFAAIADQRVLAAKEIDDDLLAAQAPGLFAPPSRFSRRSRVVIVAAVLVVALVVVAVVAKGLSHKSTPPSSAALVNTSSTCQPGVAASSVTFTSSQDAHGIYHVSATGTVTDNASVALHHVVIAWVVTYADLSTGVATRVAVPGGTIAKGATIVWSGNASTDDGQVPPTGAKVARIATSTYPEPLCGN